VQTFHLEPLENGLYKPSYENNITEGFTAHASAFFKEETKTIGDQEIDYSKKTNLVFLLIDGLGRELGYNSNLVDWFSIAGEWRSTVYPTITPTALTSIFTGKPPIIHGVTGHLIPWEKAKKIVDFIKAPCLSLTKPNNLIVREGSPLLEEGFTKQLFPPFIYSFNHANLVQRGVFSYLFGSHMQPFINFTNLYSQIVPLLKQPHRKIIIIYYAMYDIFSHFMGKMSVGAFQVISNIVRFLKKFHTYLPVELKLRTTILVGSDHGHEFINRRLKLPEADRKKLESYLYGVGKSGRTLHFYPKPDKYDEALKFLENHLSSYGLILEKNEIFELLGNRNGLKTELAMKRAGSIHFTSFPGYYLEWPFNKDFFERGLDFGRKIFYSTEHGGLSLSELQTPFFKVL